MDSNARSSPTLKHSHQMYDGALIVGGLAPSVAQES